MDRGMDRKGSVLTVFLKWNRRGNRLGGLLGGGGKKDVRTYPESQVRWLGQYVFIIKAENR